LILGSIGITVYGPAIFGAFFIAIAAAYLIREDKLRTKGNRSRPPSTEQRLRAQDRIFREFMEVRHEE